MRRTTAWTWAQLAGLLACGPVGPGEGPPAGESSTGGASPTTGVVNSTGSSGTSGPAGTSTSGSTSTGGDVASTGALEGTFLVPPDGLAGPCDPWEQDCPEGQKCNWWADDGGSSWNTTKCVPVVEDPKQLDEPCIALGGGVSGVDDCDLGMMCWDVDAEGQGFCIELCKGAPDDPHCEGPGGVCAVYSEGFGLCLEGCDPLVQDCGPADACLANNSNNGFLCVFDASGEEGQQHDPCMFANACDPGLLCNDPTTAVECDQDATGCCEPFCDLSDPNADTNCGGEGQVCNPWFEEGTAPPEFKNVGFCAVPM